MKREQITHTELLDKIRYNSKTGIFYSRDTGHRVGYYDSCNKSRLIRIGKRMYQESRIAIFYITGKWPKGRVFNKSSCRTVTKYKDLIVISQEKENPDAPITRASKNKQPKENLFVGASPQYKSCGTVMDEYHSKENFLQRFWRWLNG